MGRVKEIREKRGKSWNGIGRREEGRQEGEIGKLYASRPWFDLSAEAQAGGDDRFRGYEYELRCLTQVFHV